MYCVYLIVSDKGERYIGYTSNLKQRIAQHNAGLNKSTQGSRWKLAYAEAFLSEHDARMREAKLKDHGQSKHHLHQRAEASIKKAECWEDAIEGGAGNWGEVVTR